MVSTRARRSAVIGSTSMMLDTSARAGSARALGHHRPAGERRQGVAGDPILLADPGALQRAAAQIVAHGALVYAEPCRHVPYRIELISHLNDYKRLDSDARIRYFAETRPKDPLTRHIRGRFCGVSKRM